MSRSSAGRGKFLSTLSLRRATIMAGAGTTISPFLSTLSLRRATAQRFTTLNNIFISIHALLAEGDESGEDANDGSNDFYPRSPCGERHSFNIFLYHTAKFLSTLSLRRATRFVTAFPGSVDNFYPRSPCGERHLQHLPCEANSCISIHALLAESDLMLIFTITAEDYFYPRSPCGERRFLRP